MSIVDTVTAYREMARQQVCEKERERVKIGYLFDIPPAQLSDEQIRKYEQEIWRRRIAASIPALQIQYQL